MVNRLRQAGLNPAMLNGNAAVNQAGNLSSISTPSAPQGGRQNGNSVAAMTSLASIAQSMAQTGFLDEQAKLMTQKILSELLEQNIKQIAALTGMSEAELRRMDAEATYEAYYGTAIDGGEPRIKNNPVALAMEDMRQRIASAEAQEDYTRALETTENTLRDLRASNLRASTSEINQRVDNLKQEYERMGKEIQSMSRENAIQSAYRVIGNFFGLESISNLPPELIAKASQYYQEFMQGEYSYESTIDAFRRIVNAYNEKKIHIQTSISEAESLVLKPWEVNTSYSISHTE